MGKFNTWLVDSLDVLNKILAGIFISVSVFKFFDAVGDGVLNAVFETLIVLGAGILTCGYIALMIKINNNVAALRDKFVGPEKEDWEW